MQSSARTRSLVGAVLLALGASACVVSFDGYERAEGDAGIGGYAGAGGAGGAGGAATGGSGGVATGGSGGVATGGSGGVATGGTGGAATGGSGGVVAGGSGGVATGGTGGAATGGSGGVAAGGSGGVATGGTGGTSTGGTSGTGGTGPTCPSTPGTASMLLIQGPTTTTCVDKTEVTQEQYSAFLAGSPPTTGQPSGCTGNSSFTPTCSYNPVNMKDKPVVCVDWCDAFAYCKAAGKRLCGQVGGGPVALASGADPSKSQWHLACTQNGARTYPYGSLFDKFACVGLDNSNFPSPQNVGSVPSCQGGYPLLYDMSGNVAEWEDSCSGTSCAARGGHYLSKPNELTCGFAVTFGRMTTDISRGFRCCAG